MSRALIAVVLAFPLITLANPHYHPDVEVNVPPEVVSLSLIQLSDPTRPY
ncbi:hypothetical protein N2S64_20610, partial [Escherichia coli]|nr:hypothetical protein [Escherichia coli]